MKSPRKRYAGKQKTITCTDEAWDQIRADAARRGMSASAWFVECALTEEVTRKKAAQQRLVLDAKEQRSLSRAAAAIARGSHTNGDIPSRLADNLQAVFRTRFRNMAREGRRGEAVEALRAVLGEERAAVVAAAFIPESPLMAAPRKERQLKRQRSVHCPPEEQEMIREQARVAGKTVSGYLLDLAFSDDPEILPLVLTPGEQEEFLSCARDLKDIVPVLLQWLADTDRAGRAGAAAERCSR